MGKASSASDISDDIKNLQISTNYLQGQSRHNTASSRNIASTRPPTNSDNFEKKLSVQGGIIKGSFALKQTTTASMASNGIIDLLLYNSGRLIITNPSGFTLKVLNPVLGDGQIIYIRAVTGQTVPIQNTSGTGSLVTGNIETMAGTTYSLVGDDWIGLCYDVVDSKWHQFTAGKLNIGSSGSGEVFTWTASHSANNFNLNEVAAIQFTADATNDCRINAPPLTGLQYIVDNSPLFHSFFTSNGLKFKLTSTETELYNSLNGSFRLFNDGVEEYSFSRLIADFHGNDLNNCGTIRAEAADAIRLGDTSIAGMIQAKSGTECGFAVTNASILIGSRGTVQIPTDTNTGTTITDDTSLDSLFGNEEGCIGVTGLRGTGTPILWVRRADGSIPLWRGTFMTTTSS